MATIAKHYNFPTTILHNNTTDAEGRHPAWVRGYAPGDTLDEVFSYGHWGPNSDKDDPYLPELVRAALAEAFDLGNVLDDPYYANHPAHEEAVGYRKGGTVRSLSVGDVVKLGERRFAVASLGWVEIDADGQIINSDLV